MNNCSVNCINANNKITKRISLLIIFYLLFGYLLNDNLPFSFIDELTCLYMWFLLTVNCKGGKKELKVFYLIALFYLIYSFCFSVNRNVVGILLDAFQQLKPFIFFYSSYYLLFSFDTDQKNRILKVVVIVAIIQVVVGFLLDPTFFSGLFKHPANYANSVFSLSLLLLLLLPWTKANLIGVFVLCTCGLLSTKSKFYGEYVLFIFIVFFLKSRIKLNIKYFIVFLFVVMAILYVAKDKIMLYVGGDAAESQARTVLFLYMPQILLDYFPFGSGFASYATWFSGVYYSPLYSVYNIDTIWGMTEDWYDFIADTYFPMLAEIGISGVILFLAFWKKRLKQINNLYESNRCMYKLGMLCVGYVIIESVASPLFVSNYGFIVCFTLGLICRSSEMNKIKKDRFQ